MRSTAAAPTTIVQFALHQKAIIAKCNQTLLNMQLNTLFYKAFTSNYSWHEDCSINSIPSMLSEMTAMNSTLILLNTLALAVLLVFHFQPEPASTGQPVEMTATFNPPLPQVAVMKESRRVTPRLATNQPVADQAPAGERWVF